MIDEFIGIILAGKYEVEEKLRESDLGNVYRGKHLLMEKPVTIKILSPALAVDESIVEKFSVEARTISRLSHPNILNVTDFGSNDGITFIVMEDAEGTSLKEIVKNEGAFDEERAVRITRQIAAALSSAHSSNIIHQNLTSEKILVNRMSNDTELVKVLDIGSFNVGEDRDFEEGSLYDLAYLSPEQCSEESEPDERSDIYSLGIIFYEMLTGEVPFTADTALDLMLKHSQVPPPPLAAFREDIPEEIEPLVIRALAKNPDMRYQSAAAFAEDLRDAIKTSEEDDTYVIPKTEAATANGQNNLWKTAFILLAGISVLAFGMIYMTNMKQTDPATQYQVDADGKPVQPLNPATGISEKNISMTDYPDPTLNPEGADILPPTDGLGGGDGFDPWGRGGNPPIGAPPSAPIGQGGEIVNFPPDGGGSIFTQDDVLYDKDGNRIILVPKPVESPKPAENTSSDKEKKPNAEDKTKPATEDKTTDKGKKPETKTKPAETKTPKETKPKTPPAEKPKGKTPKPSTKNRNIKSGVEQDT